MDLLESSFTYDGRQPLKPAARIIFVEILLILVATELRQESPLFKQLRRIATARGILSVQS